MYQSFTLQYQLYVIFGLGLTVMYAIFVIIALNKYLKKRQASTLYFILSNISWCLAAIMNTAYSWDYLMTSERGALYYFSLPTEFIMTTISALFIFLFTTGMFNYKRRNILTAIIAGIIILIIILLPVNNWSVARTPSAFSFQFISMFFSVVYAVTLYLLVAILFIRLTRAKETPSYMKGIYLGAILFVVFLILTTFAGINATSEMGSILMIVGWIPMIAGSICLFYGFFKPTLTSK